MADPGAYRGGETLAVGEVERKPPGELGPGGEACGTLSSVDSAMEHSRNVPLGRGDGSADLGVFDASLLHHVVSRVEILSVLRASATARTCAFGMPRTFCILVKAFFAGSLP
jgi:hypothetical protein